MSDNIFSMGATVLKAEGISRVLGGNLILRDLDLEVKSVFHNGRYQGQVIGVLGPSGIGKTRLFRILSGLDKPEEGTVLIGDPGRPVQRGDVGVVAQHYPLFEHRTVLSNLIVAAQGNDAQASRNKANHLLEEFGIADKKHRYPCELSGGQRQRVAIAQQFMCSDHFLLMDEPFSGLDYNAIQQVSKFISGVVDNSEDVKTVILVTHDITAALSVSDTVWVLGRDRDPDGQPIPGARLRASYNLMEMGLAWQEDVATMPAFLQLTAEIRGLFPYL